VCSDTFDGTGSVHYSGTLYFGQYSKTSAGTLDVQGTPVNGRNITILGVSVSPSPAKAGKPVTFTVKLKNNYNVKKTADVTVYLGDSLKQSKSVSIAAHNTTSLTLQLVPHNPGNYTWSVQVHTSNNGNSILEDSRSGELNVLKDPAGVYGWLEVAQENIKAGSNVTLFIMVENTKDHAQTWPVEIADNTGNVWWPGPKDAIESLNYTLYSDGSLKVYAHKKAFLMATVGPIYQNTTFYLKIAGVQVAGVSVRVAGSPYLRMTSVSCGDLWLNPTSGGLSDIAYITYGGTVDCHVGFINPHDKQVSIQLSGSRVSVDFPMNHGSASVTDKSTTVYPAHSSGFVHVMFSASISDFSALAKYWVYGYYDLPVTIRLLLKEAMGGKYQTYTYVIRNHVTVKTSNTGCYSGHC